MGAVRMCKVLQGAASEASRAAGLAFRGGRRVKSGSDGSAVRLARRRFWQGLGLGLLQDAAGYGHIDTTAGRHFKE